MHGINCALLLYVVSNLLVHSVCNNVTNKRALAAVDNYVNLGAVGTFTVGFTQTITAFLLEDYMSQTSYTLTIKIFNNMKGRSMVNPVMYLANGKTVKPPMLFIHHKETEEGNVENTEIAKIVGDKNEIKGFLCYQINASRTAVERKSMCIGFDVTKSDNKFLAFTTAISNTIEMIYENLRLEMTMASARQKGKSILQSSNTLKIAVSIQMTTSKNALIYARMDNSNDIDIFQSALAKRELVILGSVVLGAVTGITGTLAQAAYRYLKTDDGTVLAIDNLSKDSDPFVLYDPEW